MDLSRVIIFKGFFRQAKYLASSETRTETPVLVSETGTIGRISMPGNTGYMSVEKEHMTWANIHSLKLKLKKYGTSIQDARVLLISERSYAPLDPLNKIKGKEREKVMSLDDIAMNKHDIARAIVNNDNSGGKTPLAEAVTYGSLIIIVICLIASRFG
jgi:hypothetical protein